jgi:hypothetical protein
MTAKLTYDPARTGLLFVVPYNDFLSEGGKLWPRVKEVAEQVGPIEIMHAAQEAERGGCAHQILTWPGCGGLSSMCH